MITKLISSKGAATRGEWWSVTVVSEIVAQLTLMALLKPALAEHSVQPIMLVSLLTLVTIGIWLTVSVSLRRLRDRGRSGWMLLLALVPVVGLIWLVVECGCLPGRSMTESSDAVPA